MYRKRVRSGLLSETVIDLNFATEDVIQRLSWCIRQEHIPIEICLDLDANLGKNRSRCADYGVDKDKMNNWYLSSSPMVTLQNTIKEALQLYYPRTNPSPYAQAALPTQATELLKDTRRARRRALASGPEIDYAKHISLCRELKRETRNIQRVSWRRFVAEVTDEKGGMHNKGLWKLTKWAKNN
ncbi:hypothetical protein Golomagni_05155 [Golovinomyces magnicellulatus]|nr:hypothetical protein Golomagni_05155 [Golovinomyces magnicellulatus]